MRQETVAFALSIGAVASGVFVMASAQVPPAGPAFDVVSIKRNTSQIGPGYVSGLVTWRPDGGVRMINIPVGNVISQAYPGNVPADMVGLPAWTRTELYDVNATSSLPRATPDDRVAMLRAMLADRFKLALHTEQRDQSVYDLVLAKAGGSLGPGIKPVDLDCGRIVADRKAAAEKALEAGTPPARPQFADLTGPQPQCTLRTISASLRLSGRVIRPGPPGDLLEGEGTMDDLATTLSLTLRFMMGRQVVNKTGLAGSYRVTMGFDGSTGRGGPVLSATDSEAPSIFTAVQEQLGLKLVASQVRRDTLVIDRLERPTEN